MFESKTDRAKYCSKKCSNRSRFERSREEQRQESDRARRQAINLYDSDMSVSEIATRIGKSTTFVYITWQNEGFPKRLTPFQQKVKKLREQGKCCVEISEIIGEPTSAVLQTVKAIGMPFTEGETMKSRQLGLEKRANTIQPKIENQVAFINSNYPDWEYIGGFVNSDGFMTIRCKKCGEVTKKSAITIRHRRNIICPKCLEKEREAKEAKKEQEKLELEQKKLDAFWNQDFRQIAMEFKTCPECGTQHLNSRTKYCSIACRRKATNRRTDKRLKKVKKKDSGINLKKIYNRDNGTCWICGGWCDWDDYTIDKKGNFIVGRTYPSIDHVYPIAKGGDHVWGNIRLAHHYCNTIKSDRVVTCE